MAAFGAASRSPGCDASNLLSHTLSLLEAHTLVGFPQRRRDRAGSHRPPVTRRATTPRRPSPPGPPSSLGPGGFPFLEPSGFRAHDRARTVHSHSWSLLLTTINSHPLPRRLPLSRVCDASHSLPSLRRGAHGGGFSQLAAGSGRVPPPAGDRRARLRSLAGLPRGLLNPGGARIPTSKRPGPPTPPAIRAAAPRAPAPAPRARAGPPGRAPRSGPAPGRRAA